MTNFEKVALTCRMYGKTTVEDLADDQVQLGVDCISEEFNELISALNSGYLPEIRKELCDLLVVVYQLGYFLGFEVDKDFDKVNNNNMGKVFSDEDLDEMVETVGMYADKNVDVVCMPTTHKHWVCVSRKDQQGSDKKYYPKGKVVKPIGFEKLELT